MKTQTEIRNAFWEAFPEFQSERRTSKRQNQYNATIRSAFVAFVDQLQKDNQISAGLADRATL